MNLNYVTYLKSDEVAFWNKEIKGLKRVYLANKKETMENFTMTTFEEIELINLHQ